MAVVTAPMSVFRHFVAQCAIAHQAAMRSARALDPAEARTDATREVARLSIALFERMHRLETLVAEMGAPAVFGTPPAELGMDEVRRLFPE